MTVYDVLIVGGGPAGLSAATALVRQLHSIVLFDSGSYRNGPSHHMHNVATWDHKDPAVFRETARNDLLARYKNVHFENSEITSIKEASNGFEATDGNGKVWHGKKVILATGVEDIFPSIEGYAECWGKGIFHCLFCHGYEERDRGPAGVLAFGMTANPNHALQLSRNAVQLCGSVTVFTNGSESVASEIKAAAGETNSIKFDVRTIKKLSLASNGNVVVEFEDGSKQDVAFIAHVPQARSRGPFVEQLGLEVAPPFNDIKVSPPFGQTNKRGVFAAGDNMIMAKAVPNALSNGSMAAVGASTQIQSELHGHKSMF